MKYFLLIFLFVVEMVFAKSQNVEITSKSFEADELTRISKFVGNVKVKKGYDTITSDKLVVNFDKKRVPIKYTAMGNAKFRLMINKKHYAGKADKITYSPVKKIYTFFGNAFLQDMDSGKKIYGDTIMINQSDGKYSVKSNGKQPVKFIFKVKDQSK